MAQYIERYVPADTNAGWGFAIFILALALACVVAATWIHKETYKHPTDVTWHGKGSGDTAPIEGQGSVAQ